MRSSLTSDSMTQEIAGLNLDLRHLFGGGGVSVVLSSKRQIIG